MRVFISHTGELASYPDPYSFVAAARESVVELEMVPVEQNYFPASVDDPARTCSDKVRECDLWLGLIGLRYGSYVPGREPPVSFVELEHQAALDAGIPCLAFLLDEHKPIAGIPAEKLYDLDDEAKRSAQGKLRDGLARRYVIRTFSEPAELRQAIVSALSSFVNADAKPTSRRRRRWTVPFLRNENIVGREPELTRLSHLLRPEPGRANRPVGIVGLAGIGKTQLIVEYVYRSTDHHADGIYWINAAEPLETGFAKLGVALDPSLGSHSIEEQIYCATDFLERNPSALLVVDNIEEPRDLLKPIIANIVPAALGCAIVYSSRRRSGPHFPTVELTGLDDESAVRLLTRDWWHGTELATRGLQHDNAVAICRTLGMLPLALEIAASHLSSLAAADMPRYRDLLMQRGALPVLDEVLARPSDVDLPTRHSTAMLATLSSQWELIRSPEARQVMAVMAQFGEGLVISQSLLRTAAGFRDQTLVFDRYASALNDLESKSLIERLSGDAIRLHPLVHEFSASRLSEEEGAGLRTEMVLRAVGFYESAANVVDDLTGHGIVALLDDLANATSLAGTGYLLSPLTALSRVLHQEASRLGADDVPDSTAAQQLLLRACLLGQDALAESSRALLRAREYPFFDLIFAVDYSASSRLVRIVEGNGSRVRSTLLSRSGRHLFIGTEDGLIRRVDMGGGGRELAYRGHTGDVRCLALSASEDRLASGSDDGTVRIWNVASAMPDRVLIGHLGSVRSVGFLAHDQELASVSHDGTIRVWHLLSGNCRIINDFVGGMEDLAIWADSSRALVASRDGVVRLRDLDQGDLLKAFPVHTAWVDSVRWVDEQRFASCSLDGTAAVWDIAEDRCLARYHVGHRVCAVDSISDANLLAFAGDDSDITLASVIPGETRAAERLTGHSDRVTALSVAAEVNLLASGSEDGTARIWSLDDGARPDLPMRPDSAARVTAVCLTDGGRIAVSAAEDGFIRAWWIATGQLAWQETVLPENIRPTCLAADGSRIVVGTEKGSLVILDARTGARLRTLELHRQPVSRVRISGNGIVLAAGDDGHVSLWDTSQEALLNASGRRRREVRALAVGEAAGIGISGAFDGSVWVHPLDQQGVAYKLGDHGEQVISVAVSPDGQVVWSASRDGTVRIWPLAGSGPLLTYGVPEDLVNCLAMSADGRWAAAGCRDGTVKIWEGQHHARLRHSWRLRGPISELYFSSTDGLLIAASRAGTCQALALDPFDVVTSVELGQTVAAAAGSTSRDLIVGGVSGGVFLLALQESRQAQASKSKGGEGAR